MIRRYFSEDKFARLRKDFAFLASKVKDYKGELDIRLRDDYFNLYYKGNSLAKIISRKDDYEVSVHNKFVEKVLEADKRLKPSEPKK
jgi:hypothetical protein